MNNNLGKEIFFWTAVVGGIALVVAGMIYLVSLQRIPSSAEALTIDNVVENDDWVLGNRDAKVTLIEYSDLQCPACASYHSVVKQIATDFGDKIAFVYRHFPLPNHQHAKTMARAAEAAGKQGKFWEMHDLIFESQSDWSSKGNVTETVVAFAKQLELDEAKFVADFESGEIETEVNEAVSEGRSIGISYTPTFFINGVRIQNPNSYAEFSTLLNEAIAASEQNASSTPNVTQ